MRSFIAPPSITAEDVTLSIAESKALPLEVNAASGYHLSYELADPTIASIDRALKQVTGQRAGTTTYTVTVTNPSGLQTSASAQITVTMPTVEVTGTKTWVDYDDMYGLRPDSVQFQLYDGDTAVGEPVNISADDNWEHTWTVPQYDDASREIYYTVKEIGSYPNYTSKPTPDGRGVINTLDSDVLIGSVTVSKTTAAEMAHLRSVWWVPEIPTMKVLSARMGPSTNGRTTTPEWWWKSPCGNLYPVRVPH